MANLFSRKVSSNVSSTPTTVGSYTVGSNVGAIVIGMSISNTNPTQVLANVMINNGITDHYIVRNAIVPAEGTLVTVGDEQKVILQTGDSVKVSASANVDVIMNVMETDTAGISTDPITYTVTSNVASVLEGNAVAYTISTTNVPNSTVLYWQIFGNVAAADFTSNTLTGNATISNGSAVVSQALVVDNSIEGSENAQFRLYSDSGRTNLIATAANVTVVDGASYVGAAGTRTDGNSTVIVSKPTGTQEGDLMVAFIMAADSGVTPTYPSGWTQAILDTTGNNSGAVAYKIAGASEPADYTFTVGGTFGRNVIISTIRNATTVLTGNYGENISTTLTAPSITAQSGLLLAWFGIEGTPILSSAPSGMTLFNNTTGGPTVWGYFQPITSGATGSKTLQVSASNSHRSILVNVY